jgi:sugar lactone lactonase YvrE
LKLNLNPTRNIADIKLKVKTDINIKNKLQLSVQKCVILPDNHFLFVDEKNERLVVHEQNGSHHHDISVSNKPFDVAVIDSRRIAVTYGRGRQLEILDIVKHKCEKIIKTGNDCWGTSYRDGNLFVVVYRKGIEVISIEGQVITVIPVNVDHVFYISLHSNKIYYTDWAENTVNCCDFNGSEIWCYGYDNVVSQQGIAADADGNVFVVGYRTNNVMVTSPDGRRYKILLTGESDGLNWPTGLFYDAQGDRLLVCNETDGHAALYDIE